jgi:hypothetical protein
MIKSEQIKWLAMRCIERLRLSASAASLPPIKQVPQSGTFNSSVDQASPHHGYSMHN